MHFRQPLKYSFLSYSFLDEGNIMYRPLVKDTMEMMVQVGRL